MRGRAIRDSADAPVPMIPMDIGIIGTAPDSRITTIPHARVLKFGFLQTIDIYITKIKSLPCIQFYQ